MDFFLAYLLYKRHNGPVTQPDWLEVTIAIVVLIAGLVQLAALCKRRI